jgi:hypothetical protein
MAANPAATAMLTVLVTSVRPARCSRTGRARSRGRSARCSLSQASAIANSGKVIPNTYARPSTTPPPGLPEKADRAMTPASTGAQQEEAIPENTPKAKKLAESPPARVGGGQEPRQLMR